MWSIDSKLGILVTCLFRHVGLVTSMLSCCQFWIVPISFSSLDLFISIPIIITRVSVF
jgi:hypothetical protein